MVKVYLERLSLYSAEEIRLSFDEISEHFISIDGSSLSNREESLLGKILLDKHLRDLSVENYTVKYHKNKKPRLICDKDLYFNISHSGDYVVLALSDSEVGCDVQEIKLYNQKLIKRCYCDNEISLIENSENKQELFISLWALKESILKFKGDGVTGGLSTYDFSPFAMMSSFTAFDCNFALKRLENGYLALCYKGGEIIFIT